MRPRPSNRQNMEKRKKPQKEGKINEEKVCCMSACGTDAAWRGGAGGRQGMARKPDRRLCAINWLYRRLQWLRFGGRPRRRGWRGRRPCDRHQQERNPVEQTEHGQQESRLDEPSGCGAVPVRRRQRAGDAEQLLSCGLQGQNRLGQRGLCRAQQAGNRADGEQRSGLRRAGQERQEGWLTEQNDPLPRDRVLQ